MTRRIGIFIVIATVAVLSVSVTNAAPVHRRAQQQQTLDHHDWVMAEIAEEEVEVDMQEVEVNERAAETIEHGESESEPRFTQVHVDTAAKLGIGAGAAASLERIQIRNQQFAERERMARLEQGLNAEVESRVGALDAAAAAILCPHLLADLQTGPGRVIHTAQPFTPVGDALVVANWLPRFAVAFPAHAAAAVVGGMGAAGRFRITGEQLIGMIRQRLRANMDITPAHVCSAQNMARAEASHEQVGVVNNRVLAQPTIGIEWELHFLRIDPYYTRIGNQFLGRSAFMNAPFQAFPYVGVQPDTSSGWKIAELVFGPLPYAQASIDKVTRFVRNFKAEAERLSLASAAARRAGGHAPAEIANPGHADTTEYDWMDFTTLGGATVVANTPAAQLGPVDAPLYDISVATMNGAGLAAQLVAAHTAQRAAAGQLPVPATVARLQARHSFLPESAWLVATNQFHLRATRCSSRRPAWGHPQVCNPAQWHTAAEMMDGEMVQVNYVMPLSALTGAQWLVTSRQVRLAAPRPDVATDMTQYARTAAVIYIKDYMGLSTAAMNSLTGAQRANLFGLFTVFFHHIGWWMVKDQLAVQRRAGVAGDYGGHAKNLFHHMIKTEVQTIVKMLDPQLTDIISEWYDRKLFTAAAAVGAAFAVGPNGQSRGASTPAQCNVRDLLKVLRVAWSKAPDGARVKDWITPLYTDSQFKSEQLNLIRMFVVAFDASHAAAVHFSPIEGGAPPAFYVGGAMGTPNGVLSVVVEARKGGCRLNDAVLRAHWGDVQAALGPVSAPLQWDGDAPWLNSGKVDTVSR